MRVRASAVPLTVTLLAVLVVSLVPVSSSAQSLADARAERAEVQRRLDRATGQLGALEDHIAELETETQELALEAQTLAESVGALEGGMQDRIVTLFKHGTVRDPLTVFLSSDEPQEALLRAQTLQKLIVGDMGELESLSADRRRLEVVTERLETQREALADALSEQRSATAALRADLERAQALEQRLEAEDRARRAAEERARKAREAARQAAASAAPASGGGGSAAVSSGGKACPVGQPRSYSDTWGAPRSGGRAHRGTDILAPYGTPVYAIVGGTWSIQRPGPSAGLWAILRGNDGNQYWYMHLQSHTVANGAKVSAGQQVATNGDTGNARGTPHVHFELHPGGGAAINPYPTVRAVCG